MTGIDKERGGGCTVGVYGLHPAAGATHVSMLLASYFSDIKKRRTEVFETRGQGAFACFEHFLRGRSDGGCFRTRRCTYYKDAGFDTLRQGKDPIGQSGNFSNKFDSLWQGKEGKICIYDLGCQDEAVRHLLLCDEKWVVGSTGVFRAGDWENFFERKEVREQIAREGANSFHLLKNHGITAEKSAVPARMDGQVYTITAYGLGTEQNVLRLSKEVKGLFAKIIR